MKPLLSRLFIFFAVAIGAGAMFCFLATETSADGRSLGEWLRRYAYSEDSAEFSAASNAIRKIGVKATPVLLEKLRATDPVWKELLSEWLSRFDIYDPNFRWAHEEHSCALFGFEILGQQAVIAIPELSEMVLDSNLTHNAAICLGLIGREALPALKSMLTNRDPTIRIEGIIGITVSPQMAQEARTDLLQMRSDCDEEVAAIAVSRLARVTSKEEAVTIARDALRDPRDFVKTQALLVLDDNGSGSGTALPEIISMLQNPSVRLRALASNVLCSIDPKVALAHGVDTNRPIVMSCGFRWARSY